MKKEKMIQVLTLGVLVLTVVILVSGLTGAAAPANGPIGLVDTEKLRDQLPDFQRLEAMVKDKQSEFEKYQGYIYESHKNTVKQLQDKATQEKNGKSTTEQAAIDKKLQEEVQKKTDESKQQLEQKYSEIQKYLNDQKKTVVDKQNKLISDTAGDQKVAVVLEKGAVLFGGTDITQAVLDKAAKEASKETKK